MAEAPKLTPEEIKPTNPLKQELSGDIEGDIPPFGKLKEAAQAAAVEEGRAPEVTPPAAPEAPAGEEAAPPGEEPGFKPGSIADVVPPAEETPTTEEKPTAPPAPPAPEAPKVETPAAPPAPPVPALEAAGIKDEAVSVNEAGEVLIDVTKTPFQETLNNPDWKPANFLEVENEREKFRKYQTDIMGKWSSHQAQAKNIQWDTELKELRTPGNRFGVTIPPVVDANNPKDPGKMAEAEIFNLAIKYGDQASGKIMPLPQAAEIWTMKKSSTPAPAQPAGATAPVAGTTREEAKAPARSYNAIKGKKTDEIIEAFLRSEGD